MFGEIGGLINYWHIIALSDEVGRNQSLKTKIYGHSILVWKDSAGALFAVSDCCLHKRSPLKVADYQTNELVCPYHGWRYDAQGNLSEVPSSPHLDIAKLNCTLQTFAVREAYGFVWIFLNPKVEAEAVALPVDEEPIRAWGSTSLSYLFDTTEELLIENFMDATHTPFAHKGLIRGHGEKVLHTVKLSSTAHGVLAEYSETEENVGLGLRFLLGKKLKTLHLDEFLLPNLVKVDYHINAVHRFSAFIACTPLEEGKTKAFIRLSYNFKGYNFLVKSLLPRMARKVLEQDYEITKKQYDNQQEFTDLKEHHVDCDIMPNKVNLVRKAVINHQPVKPIDTTFKLSL